MSIRRSFSPCVLSGAALCAWLSTSCTETTGSGDGQVEAGSTESTESSDPEPQAVGAEPAMAPSPGEPEAGPNEPSPGSEPEPEGSAGAGPGSSAGSFFGDSRCSPDFLLCEDFESGELDLGVWEPQGPAPSVEDTMAARGQYAAHFHTEGNALSLIRQSVTFPAPNNRYYARAFVHFSTMPTAPRWAHWTISGAVGSGDSSEIRVGGQYDGETNRFGVGTDGGPTGDWTNLDQDPEGNPRAVPEGEWLCLEWVNDGETGESRFFWDEVEHPSLFTSRTEHGGSQDDYVLPDFESMWFGWWLYQPDPTPGEFDVWMDELVVDDEPIGCTR